MKENSYGGLLVCLDGPNGSGKSTLISEIIKKIPDCNVINTAEPTKTKLGSTVRKLAEEYD